jgi:hypothetical protein
LLRRAADTVEANTGDFLEVFAHLNRAIVAKHPAQDGQVTIVADMSGLVVSYQILLFLLRLANLTNRNGISQDIGCLIAEREGVIETATWLVTIGALTITVLDQSQGS